MSDDTATLMTTLDAQRRHVLAAVDGLTAEQLGTSVLPSGWTPLGLIHHLAVDVERFWFRAVMTDDKAAWESLEDAPSAWQVPDGVDAIGLYRDEIDRADAIIRASSADASPATWPDFFGSFRLHDLREVLLHVITETACHAGHLDAARELLDGQQFMVLT
jgi:hypothetical protein